MEPAAAGGAAAGSVDVAVIGGGASGLTAAIAAAREGASVCVLECDVEAGLSVLATGNGRCNLSNAHLDPACYRHPDAFASVAGPGPEARIRSFFEGLGLMVAEEEEGRLYPVTRRAESVRAVLLGACTRAGVSVRRACRLQGVARDAVRGPWRLSLLEPAEPLRAATGRDMHATVRGERRALAAAPMEERALDAGRVVIACGDGIEAVSALFGLPCLALSPVLCPIACCPDTALQTDRALFERLDGLRVEGALTLLRADGPHAHETGEVLFRSYGISGIAAFNLSRLIQPSDQLELDFFPQLDERALLDLFRRRESLVGPYRPPRARWFDGLLAPALGDLVDAAVAANPDPVAGAANLCKHLPLTVLGTAGTEQAQAHRGGVPIEAVDLGSLAACGACAPGLYICGSALDMDAACGGFNLAWAWLSGLRAGGAAGRAAAGPAPASTGTLPDAPSQAPGRVPADRGPAPAAGCHGSDQTTA